MIRRFNRYELKYVVHAKARERLVEDLNHFMVPDGYGDEDGFYRITSLYYDSPDFAFYRSKMDGLKFRRKLRIRVYPTGHPEALEHAFVEIKQRMNRTVQKRRLRLPMADALSLCAGDFDRPVEDTRDAATVSEVLYLVRAMQLRPACMVTYRRQAFLGNRYESGMRVTFDAAVGGRITGLDFEQDEGNTLVIPPDWYVMEVKVNERIPLWMVSLLARNDCELRRVSKYCAVMKAGYSQRSFQLTHAGGSLWTN